MAPFKFIFLAASILARSSFALPTEQFDIDTLDDHNDIPLNVTNHRMMRRQQEDRNLVFVAPGEIRLMLGTLLEISKIPRDRPRLLLLLSSGTASLKPAAIQHAVAKTLVKSLPWDGRHTLNTALKCISKALSHRTCAITFSACCDRLSTEL